MTLDVFDPVDVVGVFGVVDVFDEGVCLDIGLRAGDDDCCRDGVDDDDGCRDGVDDDDGD